MNAPLPTWIVTGGAGFIGSNFIHHVVGRGLARVVNLDLLTYAGNLENLASLGSGAPGSSPTSGREPGAHVFVQGDICDRALVARLLAEHRPQALVNFAAESHVDRSIDGPGEFIRTNVVGTFELLEATRAHLASLQASGASGAAEAGAFRFLQVSTDEVYGSLGDSGYFTEESRHAPSSPYSASKASADHLVRAYHETYRLPALTTNCSNNYGPYQFPEKLIPLVMLNALDGKKLPVYGDGRNIRDWLFVEDHCEAIATVLAKGAVGQTYAVGGHNEWRNIDIVNLLCDLLDELHPAAPGLGIKTYRDLITFVKDRPGHDRRYAIDASKIQRELGWTPKHTFEQGIRKTVGWYLENRAWCDRITSGVYRRERLGLTSEGAASQGTPA